LLPKCGSPCGEAPILATPTPRLSLGYHGKWRIWQASASLLFYTSSALNYPKSTWLTMWKEGEEEEENLQKNTDM
jgi:hypothetical protein